MFRMCFPLLTLLFVVCAFVLVRPEKAVAVEDATRPMEWLPVTDSRFEIDGLPFLKENGGELCRFPLRLKKEIPEGAWTQSLALSGARIRFRSDAGDLAIRVTYPSLPSMRNMHAFGQSGVDLYVDGKYVSSVAPRKEKVVEDSFFKEQEKKEREITIYLPLYMSLDVDGIGVTPGASILPPARFAVDKPVVFYGTSITQAGCASRPGLGHAAMLGRRLNIDFVNFGLSGAGKGEPVVADVVSDVSASCYVLEMAQNNKSAENVTEVYLPFIETLRKKHPVTPIVCVTPIYMAPEGLMKSHGEIGKMREVIRDVYQKRLMAGDKNIFIVEGFEMLSPEQGDGFVDGVHPNDLGFHWMANGLEPHLKKILGL